MYNCSIKLQSINLRKESIFISPCLALATNYLYTVSLFLFSTFLTNVNVEKMCRLLIKLWSIIMIWNGPNMTWLNLFCITLSLVFFTCSCLFPVFLDQLDLIEIIMYLTAVIVFDKFKIEKSEVIFIFIIVNTII